MAEEKKSKPAKAESKKTDSKKASSTSTSKEKKGQNGKGDAPRNCFSEDYRSNFDGIDWNK